MATREGGITRAYACPWGRSIHRGMQTMKKQSASLYVALALAGCLCSCSDANPEFIADAMFGETDVSIHIFSPAGNASYLRGAKMTIVWDAVPGFDDVDILLIRGTAVAAIIVEAYPDYRQFAYTIPASLANANDYRVRIIGHRQEFSVQSDTERFRIY